jgi:hypothetical protein
MFARRAQQVTPTFVPNRAMAFIDGGRNFGCPILAASLFLRLGWERALFLCLTGLFSLQRRRRQAAMIRSDAFPRITATSRAW